ncbi:hypothetical protein GW916_05365 [bacterium]|nr:hypothetical protein [bacterium]
MTRYKILVVGTSESIQSTRASELLGFLSSHGEAPVCLSNASEYQHDNYDLMFIVATGSDLSSIDEWVSKVKAGELMVRTLVLYDDPIREAWREVLDPEIEIGEEHALLESIDYLFEEEMEPATGTGSLSLQPDSNVGNPISFDLGLDDSSEGMSVEGDSDANDDVDALNFESVAAGTEVDADALGVGDLGLNVDGEADDGGMSIDSTSDSSESTHLFDDSPVPSDDAHTELFSSDAANDELNGDSLDFNSEAEVDSFDLNGEAEVDSSDELAASGLNIDDEDSDLDSAAALLGADLAGQLGEDAGISDAAIEESAIDMEMFSSGPIAQSSDDLSEDDLALNLESNSVESKIEHPDADISGPLAGRDTFAAEIKDEPVIPGNDALFDDGLDFDSMANENANAPSMVDPALSKHLKSDDISTVQKYAAMKEREAREKDATVRVLKGQMSKLEAKLTQDVQERRRLSLANDDLQSQVNSYEEELSQKQFHIQKMEGTHQEELRALSLRLDNAIFQASKAQNKLEDFRERVRGDFVKIRAQERELYNKLELQKRDAEALLASKDEQLLDQRREIDRLHYELDGLRERMVEETEKAEDRSARIKRATQSLKLANDLLSGLAEEVLPSASDRDVPMTGFEKGDDAA